ncbi:hypothetical protein [Pseudonocardia acaciae]|uniref:hypothetical protein n=1 Tax=Pseudonocardia acaciae TaxID=551276 RepID=UPI000490680C|nr:hypothetical protein [Pseudonocardia acaciae]
MSMHNEALHVEDMITQSAPAKALSLVRALRTAAVAAPGRPSPRDLASIHAEMTPAAERRRHG